MSRACQDCGQDHPKSAFSSSQWKKGPGKSRCVDCAVAQAEKNNSGPPPTTDDDEDDFFKGATIMNLSVAGGRLKVTPQIEPWGSEITQLQLADWCISGELRGEEWVIPIIKPRTTAAERLPAASEDAFIKFTRCLEGIVLDSQVVVFHQNGNGKYGDVHNELASTLAGCEVRGFAAFALVGRKPGPGGVHELYYFTDNLWASFLDYMQNVSSLLKRTANVMMRMHWNNMPMDQREPFVLTREGPVVLARCVGGGLRKRSG